MRKSGVFYRFNAKNWRFSVQILFSKNFASVKKMTNMRYVGDAKSGGDGATTCPQMGLELFGEAFLGAKV